jgi:hypothetical protein
VNYILCQVLSLTGVLLCIQHNEENLSIFSVARMRIHDFPNGGNFSRISGINRMGYTKLGCLMGRCSSIGRPTAHGRHHGRPGSNRAGHLGVEGVTWQLV